MTTSEQAIYKFAQHYIANPRIIRSTRGTNMTAINLGMYHLEISNSEVSQVLFRLSRWENLEHAKKI